MFMDRMGRANETKRAIIVGENAQEMPTFLLQAAQGNWLASLNNAGKGKPRV